VLGRLSRHELTDKELERREGLLPVDPSRGGRWVGHRTVINGILFRTRAGAHGVTCPDGKVSAITGGSGGTAVLLPVFCLADSTAAMPSWTDMTAAELISKSATAIRGDNREPSDLDQLTLLRETGKHPGAAHDHAA
jgi:hypothetical protein